MTGREHMGTLPEADVRVATLMDAEDVAGLLETLGYPCTRDDAASRIMAITDNHRQVLLLARCGGVVCGLISLDFMYYLPLDTTTCRITAMVVTPEAQGRGLGRQLLREAERRGRAGGAARIEITSGSQRTDAHKFYRDNGYSDGTVRFVKYLTA